MAKSGSKSDKQSDVCVPLPDELYYAMSQTEWDTLLQKNFAGPSVRCKAAYAACMLKQHGHEKRWSKDKLNGIFAIVGVKTGDTTPPIGNKQSRTELGHFKILMLGVDGTIADSEYLYKVPCAGNKTKPMEIEYSGACMQFYGKDGIKCYKFINEDVRKKVEKRLKAILNRDVFSDSKMEIYSHNDIGDTDQVGRMTKNKMLFTSRRSKKPQSPPQSQPQYPPNEKSNLTPPQSQPQYPPFEKPNLTPPQSQPKYQTMNPSVQKFPEPVKLETSPSTKVTPKFAPPIVEKAQPQQKIPEAKKDLPIHSQKPPESKPTVKEPKKPKPNFFSSKKKKSESSHSVNEKPSKTTPDSKKNIKPEKNVKSNKAQPPKFSAPPLKADSPVQPAKAPPSMPSKIASVSAPPKTPKPVTVPKFNTPPKMAPVAPPPEAPKPVTVPKSNTPPKMTPVAPPPEAPKPVTVPKSNTPPKMVPIPPPPKQPQSSAELKKQLPPTQTKPLEEPIVETSPSESSPSKPGLGNLLNDIRTGTSLKKTSKSEEEFKPQTSENAVFDKLTAQINQMRTVGGLAQDDSSDDEEDDSDW